jgi:hypothetical protein
MNDGSQRSVIGGWPDVLAFGAAFVIGLSAYFILRVSEINQMWISATLVGIMVVYAVIAGGLPRLRLRRDQGADNTYYLGLLFTLASMAFALHDFGNAQLDALSTLDGNAGAAEIIANFGIALATTIAGIFLRIILNQMRVDPAEVEAASRLELAQAAGQVRETLNVVSKDMGLLLAEMRQRAQDHHEAFTADAKRLLEEAQASASHVVTEAAQQLASAQAQAIDTLARPMGELTALADAVVEAVSRLRAVEPPPLKLANRLEKVGAALETLSGAVERANHGLDGIADAATHVHQDVQQDAATLMNSLAKSAQEREQGWHSLDVGASQLRDSLARIREEIDRGREGWSSLEAQASEAIRTALTLEDAAHRVIHAFTEITRTMTQRLSGNTDAGLVQ